jgi:hypothetical protein
MTKDFGFLPLTTQFWGEMTLVFGFLPPELGGWGGLVQYYRAYPNSIGSAPTKIGSYLIHDPEHPNS